MVEPAACGRRLLVELRIAHLGEAGLDLFQLLAALLIGVGFAAATGMRRRAGLWVGLALFLAFVGVFGLGLPGMMAGGGQGPGPGGPRGGG